MVDFDSPDISSCHGTVGTSASARPSSANVEAEAAAEDRLLDGMARAFHDHGALRQDGVDVDVLRTVDPDFEDAAFVAIARETFHKVRTARSRQAPELCEAVLSPELQARLITAVAGDVASRRRHLLPWLEIRSAQIAAVAVEDGRERVIVRFRLSGQELDRDEATGAVVSGDEVPRTWDEEWRFERDPSVDSSAVDRAHVLSVGVDGWMVPHRGWIVVAIDRLPSTTAG